MLAGWLTGDGLVSWFVLIIITVVRCMAGKTMAVVTALVVVVVVTVLEGAAVVVLVVVAVVFLFL